MGGSWGLGGGGLLSDSRMEMGVLGGDDGDLGGVLVIPGTGDMGASNSSGMGGAP